MKKFAIVKNDIVENIVNAEDILIAQSLVGNSFTAIEETEETRPAFIGGQFYKEKFLPIKPYDSWKLDEETVSWVPPIPFPKLGEETYCEWDEKNKDWIIKKFSDRINGA
jgi:hypothetical protein